MELYQEKLINALKMYQNDFDNMVSSFYDNKDNFDSLIKKYSCDTEDDVDKNYLLRARLSFSILYYTNLKGLKKDAVKNIIIYLFEEEIKDRKTSKYKGIGIALEVLTFLLNQYNKDNKELFEKAKNANSDCSIGYDDNVRFEMNIENLNIYYCPKCGAKLKYDYYNFETLGKYECPKCDFKWIKPKDIATNLDLDKGLIKIDSQILSIGGDMLIHAYNTLAAYTFLKAIGIDSQKIIASINRYNHNKNIEFVKDGKLYKALNCKAENATTYNACVYKTYLDKDLKDIVIGWKEISRRYNHFDVSWLYDVEFELLNNKSLNKIYAVGIDKENIKKRLLLAGIPESKIITADNLSEIKESIEQSKAKKVYGILNFDYMEPFKDTLGGE